jgi:serine/threonine protein kinase
MDGCLRRCLTQHESSREFAAGEAQKLVCGRFELGECIGQGGFADVWSAADARKRGGKVALALKRLKTPWSDEASARRAYREISVQQSLRHDNLLPLLACYRDDETPDPSQQTVWIVLPRLELDLHVAIRSRRVTTDAQRRSIAFQLLCATAHLHARRLAHRDIKPVNILLSTAPPPSGKPRAAASRQGTRTGGDEEMPGPEVRFEVKLCDFGLVRPEGGPALSGGAFAPPPEIYAGSRWYTAPEVLLGSGDVTCLADMWSVGCVLSELHTGFTLFVGTSTADQLRRTVAMTGAPTEEDISEMRQSAPAAAAALARMTPPVGDASVRLPSLPDDNVNDLLRALLRLVPKNRLSAQAALAHPHVVSAGSEEEARAAADACAPPTEEEMARLTPQLGDFELASTYRRFVNSNLVVNPIPVGEDEQEPEEEGDVGAAKPLVHEEAAQGDGVSGVEIPEEGTVEPSAGEFAHMTGAAEMEQAWEPTGGEAAAPSATES